MSVIYDLYLLLQVSANRTEIVYSTANHSDESVPRCK